MGSTNPMHWDGTVIPGPRLKVSLACKTLTVSGSLKHMGPNALGHKISRTSISRYPCIHHDDLIKTRSHPTPLLTHPDYS